MANTVVPQPQPVQQPAAPSVAAAPASTIPNDQAAAAAAGERRRRAAAAVPPEWKIALSTLIPPDAGTGAPVPLVMPPLPTLRRATYKLAVNNVKGATEAQAYLLAAEANAVCIGVLSDIIRASTTDKAAFLQLKLTLDTVTHNGDLDRAGLDVLRLLAMVTEDGKAYLRQDDRQMPAPMAAGLEAYIQENYPSPRDMASYTKKQTLTGIVSAIHDPHSATLPAATPSGPPPLTADQVRATESLLARIKQVFPPGKGLPANANAAQVAAQRATPSQMDALMSAIQQADPRVRDAVYAWRDPSGQSVLQLLGTYLTPSQVEQAVGVLDPVERVFKELQDLAMGRRDQSAPQTTSYQIFHDFLAAHLNDEPTRQRTLQHAPLIQQFYQPMTTAQQRVIMRMIISGREAPDAVDRLHDAADAGDSAAAVAAIIELGGTPQRLQTLRADQLFTHRLQDKCNARIAYQGIEVKPYDLFLRMCGVDPHDTQEAGSLAKQTEVNPSPTPEPPLTPAERAQLDGYVYEPHKQPLADELNSWTYVSDSTVMGILGSFQSRAAQPDMVALLRRAHEAPGPELARRTQGAGCDVRLKLQRGLDGDNLVQAERILGFVTDQAAVGVIGGKGALASDYKGVNGSGVVPLPQALRETLVNGQVLSQIIQDKAKEMDDALGAWFYKADKVKTVWRNYRGIVTDAVAADIRVKTGLPRVWPIEWLSNAYLQIGGTSLQSKMQDKFDGDDEGAMAEMGMRPGDFATRRQLAAADFKQQQDAAANAAAEEAARKQVEAAKQAESFRSPAQELFHSLSTLTPYVADDTLRAIGAQLQKGLQMAALAAPATIQLGPTPAPVAERDPGARPGGPVHPGEGTPLDFKSFYKREHGIDPTRHCVEVAKAMGNESRPSAKVGELFGVTAADLTAAPPAPPAGDELVINESNRTLVAPDFTVAKAESTANELWERLHGNGQIQFLRVLVEAHSQEEQRLIHIAFRRKSGGIDLQFYIEQHLEQEKEGSGDFAVEAGGAGADGKDTRRLDIHGTAAETELMLEASKKGRVSLETRLLASVKANNMDDVYRTIESASAEERRAVLQNNDVMGKLRAFGDDSYEWNRIYKGLSGESDMFDRLESRAHGQHGFIGIFQGTDEKGMSTDIRAYAKQRRQAITEEVCGDKPATDAQKKVIEQRLQAEFQSISENPSVRAILQDELSGVEKADREGLIQNAGVDSNVSSALTEGDWTEDEERILADIKKMSAEERARLRANPEYINQLHKAIQSETCWRDAMIALASTEDGSKGENDDNYGKLERASRSFRQDSSEMMFEQDDVIQALSKLSPSEFKRLQADPRLQAQILTSLEGHDEETALARKMMAYDAAGAAAATGLQIGDRPDPTKGIYTRDQVDRVAFLKFSAVNQLRAAGTRSWAMLLQASAAIYQMKLKPSEGEKPAGEPAPAAAPAQAPAPATAAAPQPQQQQQAPANEPAADPNAVKPPDPGAAEAAFDDKLRGEIWQTVADEVASETAAWGDQEHTDSATHLKKQIGSAEQSKVIERAIRHQEDPSPDLLNASIGTIKNDSDRIKETLRKASDDELITQWTTIMQTSANGTPSMKMAFDKWIALRNAAGGPSPSGTPRQPKVGTPEWEALVDVKGYCIDTSRVFEEELLGAAGGYFGDTHKTGDGEMATRDNKEWLEWRTIIRERIPGLEPTKIAAALGAKDPEARTLVMDRRLSNVRTTGAADDEKYQVARGENSNFNMDRVFAGGEGMAEDTAYVRYKQGATEAMLAPTADGAQYGDISAEEQGRINELRERFNQSDSEFRAAKAQVANIAATVVTLIITAAVTVLTAGLATGPVAVALLGALTAGAASVGANATKEAVQGTDFDFTDEGLKSIALDTVMGAVTAGTTFYAGKLAAPLFKATSAIEQGALVTAVAQNPSFLAGMGKTVVEQTLQNGMQGVFETGMAAFDPALWLDGWHEGWRRGGAAARERASHIPGDAMHAAILAALTHTVSTGAGKMYGKATGKEEAAIDAVEETAEDAAVQRLGKKVKAADDEEASLEHAALGTRASFGDRARQVGSTMVHGVGEGLIMGGAEVVLDERTYRSEGLKLEGIAGKLGSNAVEMMKMSATNIHASDAAAVMRFRAGARELATNGASLSPTEQRLYADVSMRGEGTTVLSVAEFRQVRGEMVDKGVARYEEQTKQKLTPEQRAAFGTYCRESTSFEEFRARAEGGPDKTPGSHLAAAAIASFDTPVQRGAEIERAEQLIASMLPVIQASAGRRAEFAEIWPVREKLVVEAAQALGTIKAGAPEHAASADLISRVNQASSELANAIDTSASGTSAMGMLRAELQLRLAAAKDGKSDPKLYAQLHEAVVSSAATLATAPRAIDGAGPIAQAKLVELRALVAEAHQLEEQAARSVGIGPAAPVDVAPAAPPPGVDAKTGKPVKPADPVVADPVVAAKEPVVDPAAKPDVVAAPVVADPAKAAKPDEPVAAKTEAGPYKAPILGGDLAGKTEPADPQRTQRAIDKALGGALPEGVIAHGDTLLMSRGEHELVFVKMEVATESDNPFAPVAAATFTGRDQIVIRVSPTASEAQIQRAVAGKLAELAHVVTERANGTRTETTSSLVEGAQTTKLSPRDYNMIAQLKTAIHQVEAARAANDPTADAMQRDAYALAVGMGLVENAPSKPVHLGPEDATNPDRVTGQAASDRRLAMMDEVLGPDAAKVRALVSEARANAPAIDNIRAQRAEATERLRAKCKEMIAERAVKDAALKKLVDATLGADGSGAVFDRIIVGGGWAATADYATMNRGPGGDGVPPVMAISHGGDPWAGRGDLLMGQNPAELEVAGFAVQPGDLATDPHDFTKSSDFSTAVGASAAASGMPTYDASVSKIEKRPETGAEGWPDGANYRITANNRSFFTKTVDVVSGPGPARTPNGAGHIGDPSGFMIDTRTGQFLRHTPGGAEEYLPVKPEDVPDGVRQKLESERGRLSTTFVDQQSGYSVNASGERPRVFDKAGHPVEITEVPAEIAKRLGLPRGDAKSWRSDDGPPLVDADGRPQTTRVFDAESKLSIDVATKKVYGADGKTVDPSTLDAETKSRLGFNHDGKFRDPRFIHGPGGRSVNPVTGAVIETKTGKPVDVTKLSDTDQAALKELIDRHRVQFGGTLLADDYAGTTGTDGKVPNVLIYGAGASGAWDVEQAIQGGATAEWVGRLSLPDPKDFPAGSQQQKDFTELRNADTTPDRRRELLVQYKEIIVQETLKGGKNRRNSVPEIGAYSADVQKGGSLDKDAKTIVDLQQTTDGRFYVRFSDGSDGLYDRAIMSIGQDASGAGGVQDITRGMRLQGLHGESGELVGAQDTDGGLRIIGAAGMGNPMMDRLGEAEKRRGLRQQQDLPSDSRNINVSINNNAYRIQEANMAQAGGDTAAEAAKRSELERAHDPATAERLFRAWRDQQGVSSIPVSKEVGPVNDAIKKWEKDANDTINAALALQQRTLVHLGTEAAQQELVAKIVTRNGLTRTQAQRLVEVLNTTPFYYTLGDVAAMKDQLLNQAATPRKDGKHEAEIPSPNEVFSGTSISELKQALAVVSPIAATLATRGGGDPVAPMPAAAPAAPPAAPPG